WVPEAARLLRAGGRLVFHTTSVLAALCCPDQPGPARGELVRPQREARRLVTAEGAVEFRPSHGEWITILRAPTTSWRAPTGHASGPSRKSGMSAGRLSTCRSPCSGHSGRSAR